MQAPTPRLTPRSRAIALSCAAVALLATATGCSEVQAGELDDGTSQSAQADSKRPTRGHTQEQDAKSRAESLVAAARTAASVVNNTEVTGLEFVDDGWTVRLASPEGAGHEVRIKSNGNTLIGLPAPKQTSKQARAQARLRLSLAQVDHRKALKSFQENGPGGQVRSLELRNHQDRVVWTVRLETGPTFHVDALTGHLTDD